MSFEAKTDTETDTNKKKQAGRATIKSILNGEDQNPGTVTIKKLCDGAEITLGKFFSTPEFDSLEQEIV